MTDHSTPTLLQNAPYFSPVRTREAWWRKLDYKLKAFYEHGGEFRERTIEKYEMAQNKTRYPTMHKNNCYGGALGLCLSGERCVSPGDLAIMQPDPHVSHRLFVNNSDNILMKYGPIAHDSVRFQQQLATGLQHDGIQSDIACDQVGYYQPIIIMVYDTSHGTSQPEKMDYNCLAVHATPKNGQPSFSFSGRNGQEGAYEFYPNKTEFVLQLLNNSCKSVDIYFAPIRLIGMEIAVTNQLQHNKKVLDNDAAALPQATHIKNVMGLELAL